MDRHYRGLMKGSLFVSSGPAYIDMSCGRVDVVFSDRFCGCYRMILEGP